MKPTEKTATVSEMLGKALIASSRNGEPKTDSVLGYLTRESPKLAAALKDNPQRTANMAAAVERAIRAHNYWVKEGKPCPLQERLASSARQMIAILR